MFLPPLGCPRMMTASPDKTYYTQHKSGAYQARKREIPISLFRENIAAVVFPAVLVVELTWRSIKKFNQGVSPKLSSQMVRTYFK